MAKRKICCLAGPRPSRLPFGDDEKHPTCILLVNTLRTCLEELISDGYRHFICGLSQGVDTYMAELVLELKEKYHDIYLECALPNERQPNFWLECDRNRYYRILEHCDKEIYVSHTLSPKSFTARNAYMIYKSDYLLAACNNLSGGMRELVRFALEKNLGVTVVDIRECTVLNYRNTVH